jgi:hypothetical protein
LDFVLKNGVPVVSAQKIDAGMPGVTGQKLNFSLSGEAFEPEAGFYA